MHLSPRRFPLMGLVPQQPHFLPQKLKADRRDAWAPLQALQKQWLLPPSICQVVTAASAQNHLEARAGSGLHSGPPVAASCTLGAHGPSQWPQLGAGGQCVRCHPEPASSCLSWPPDSARLRRDEEGPPLQLEGPWSLDKPRPESGFFF